MSKLTADQIKQFIDGINDAIMSSSDKRFSIIDSGDLNVDQIDKETFQLNFTRNIDDINPNYKGHGPGRYVMVGMSKLSLQIKVIEEYILFDDDEQ